MPQSIQYLLLEDGSRVLFEDGSLVILSITEFDVVEGGWKHLSKTAVYDFLALQNDDLFALQDDDLLVLYFFYPLWSQVDKSDSGDWTYLDKSE